jgi:hypothetical protein
MQSPFLIFRFFIVPLDQHLFTTPVADQQKRGWFNGEFLRNQEYRTKKGAEFALFITERTGDFVLGKLSCKRMYELHEKGTEDINLRPIEDWPFLEFLADMSRQIMLIRENTAIIREVSTLAGVLSEMANVSMFNHGYTTSFEPLVRPDSFWTEVEQSDGVYRLQFRLKSPNLFGADSDANEALRRLRERFNNTEADIVLRNEQGKLALPRKELETYRDYADKGGGSWSLTVKKGKRTRKIKSEQNAVRITIEMPDDANLLQALKIALQNFFDAA